MKTKDERRRDNNGKRIPREGQEKAGKEATAKKKKNTVE